MAEQRLKAGEVLDVLSGDEFGKGIKQIVKELQTGARRPAARFLDSVAGTTDATGALTLTSKSPSPGRAWELRRIAVCPAALNTIVNPTGVFLYRSDQAATNFLDISTTLPAVSSWDDFQLIIRPGAPIIAVFVGATIGANFTLSLHGIDHNSSELERQIKA